MSLEDLNEQIYKREEGEKSKSRFSFAQIPAIHIPEADPTLSRWADRPPKTPFQKNSLKEHFFKRKKLIIGLLLALLTLVSLLVFVGRRTLLFNPDLVTVELTGPKITETGTLVTFTVRYTNPNWVKLAESELVITYPETFHLSTTEGWKVARRQAIRTLPPLEDRAHGELTFTGNFQSFDQTTALLSASLRYGPEGLGSRAEKKDEWGVELERSLIGIEINGPPTVMSGQNVEYTVEYHNNSEETLGTGEILLEYPEGFTPTAFAPEPKRDERVWGISVLKGGMRGSISIKGVVIGSTGDSKRIIARVGKQSGDGKFLTLAEEEKVTQIIAPPLSITLTADGANGVVEAGQMLSFRLSFQNESSFGLRDLIATVRLDPATVDVTDLLVPKGVTYSKATQQVTFKAADVPILRSLDPGKKGEITFSVPVRRDLSTIGAHDVEILVTTAMDSPDIPHSTNTEALVARGEIRFKVRTTANASVSGYFYDAAYPNSGPMPTRVGEETTYTLHLAAASSLNTLGDGKMTLNFPSTTRFLGVVSPDQTEVSFNERTGELIWKPGNIASGVNNTKMVAIRIGVTPPPNSVGQTLSLMNKGEFTARDAFTNTDVKVDISEKTMDLPEDVRLSHNETRVTSGQ